MKGGVDACVTNTLSKCITHAEARTSQRFCDGLRVLSTGPNVNK